MTYAVSLGRPPRLPLALAADALASLLARPPMRPKVDAALASASASRHAGHLPRLSLIGTNTPRALRISVREHPGHVVISYLAAIINLAGWVFNVVPA